MALRALFTDSDVFCFFLESDIKFITDPSSNGVFVFDA